MLMQLAQFPSKRLCVKAIEIQLAVAAGTGWVVRCLGAPTVHWGCHTSIAG